MTVEQFIITFFVGVGVGFMLALWVVVPAKQEEKQQSAEELSSVMREQMQFQQSQNMLRAMQLEQLRQEAEYKDFEQKRLQQMSQIDRLNRYDLTKALEDLQDRAS